MQETDSAAGFYRSLKERYVKNRQAPWKAKEEYRAAFWGGIFFKADSNST